MEMCMVILGLKPIIFLYMAYKKHVVILNKVSFSQRKEVQHKTVSTLFI